MPILRAWMIIFGSLGVILVLLGLYHARMLPSGGEDRRSGNIKEVARTYWDVVVQFFQKPNIILLLIFIFLYRAGEGQLVKIGPLFLKAARADHGLGLSTAQFGTIYGTLGTAAFIGGTVLGGYFTSWLGLKRAIVPLIIIMNLPNVAYVYLSTALPANSALIATALSVEMFGYGFGFVGVILLMMQEIAPGKYQAAHYAFANSLMNLGLIVPGAVSGYIQKWIGYQKFFIWVLIAAIPALAMARFIPIGGKRRAATNADESLGGGAIGTGIPRCKVQSQKNAMTLEQAVGQQFLLTFEGREAPPDQFLEVLRRQHVGGVVLFRHKNMGNLTELRGSDPGPAARR